MRAEIGEVRRTLGKGGFVYLRLFFQPFHKGFHRGPKNTRPSVDIEHPEGLFRKQFDELAGANFLLDPLPYGIGNPVAAAYRLHDQVAGHV